MKRPQIIWIPIFVALTLCSGFALESTGQPPSDPSAWSNALAQRARWPKKVHLLIACNFDIVLNGVKKGAITLPKGTAVEIRSVNGEQLLLSSGGMEGSAPYTATDLLSSIGVAASEPPPVANATPFLIHTPFKLLPFGDIKPEGWIREQMLRDITSGNTAHLDMLRPLGAPIAANTRRGYGEFEGNFADAIIRNAILTGYQPMLDRAKEIADYVVNHQDEKGYVGRKRADSFQELSQNESELWSQCCLLRAFLAYYEYSKDKKYLDAATKSVDYMISVFGDANNKYFVSEDSFEGGARAHGLMYTDVLEKLYQLTGNRKYLEFAFRLYDGYSTSHNLKNTDHQLPMLLDKDKLFEFHAPHAAEHARAIYWLSTETNDQRYKEAAANSMSKLLASLSPSGGLVTGDTTLECVGGNPGSADLRYEYCSITEAAISLESAFQKSGNTSTAEAAENIVLNAAQAARFPDGKANAYLSKDNQIEAVGNPDKATFRQQYAACHRIACCVYNVDRVMPYYVAHLWMKTGDEKALVASFYGPSVLTTQMNGAAVQITERTLYPFENDIEMTVDPVHDVPFDILLRAPSWATQTNVTAAGAKQSRQDGYVRLTKSWTKGDVIKITFTPQIEIKTTSDKEAYVKRGALLYALGFNDEKIPTQKWEDVDLANYDIRLANGEDSKKFADYKLPPKNGTAPENASALFTYSRNLKASEQFPFDTPYGFIKTKFLFEGSEVDGELIPLGSAVLRKLSFDE